MASLQLALKKVDRAAVEAALPLFETVDVDPGVAVTEEGDTGDALLFLERGTLVAEAGGIEVGRLEAGTLFGEIALFTDGTRTATTRALEPVRVRLLRREAYEALRARSSPVAWEIERIAAHNLARWLRELVTTIAHANAASSLVTVATGTLSAGRPVTSTPALLLKRLGQIPTFADAAPGVLEAIGPHLSVRSWQPGEKMAAAGQDPPGFLLVLSGDVEIVAQVTDTRGVRLETGSTGTLVGVSALVAQGPMRGWVTVASPVAAVRAEPSQFRRWFQADDLVGSAIRLACVRDLANQVTNANGAVAMLALVPRR